MAVVQFCSPSLEAIDFDHNYGRAVIVFGLLFFSLFSFPL